MRGSCSRLRRTAVLLLLALRAHERTVGEEGGLHRSRGLGVPPVRSPAPNGGLPPEGGAGIRAAAGPDRGPHRGGSYLHLEVRFPLGVPGLLPLSFVVGNVYPPSSVRRRVRLQERPFGGFARGGLPVGCRQCTDGAKMVLFVTGICSFHCFYCPVSDEKMYKDVVFADENRLTLRPVPRPDGRDRGPPDPGAGGGPRPPDRVGRGRGPRLREPERDGVLRRELPADEGPRVRDEARALVRREGGRPGRPADPRTQVADDGPLLHERVQGRMAAPIAHQTAGGERRATLGGRDGRWDAGQGNLGRI